MTCKWYLTDNGHRSKNDVVKITAKKRDRNMDSTNSNNNNDKNNSNSKSSTWQDSSLGST